MRSRWRSAALSCGAALALAGCSVLRTEDVVATATNSVVTSTVDTVTPTTVAIPTTTSIPTTSSTTTTLPASATRFDMQTLTADLASVVGDLHHATSFRIGMIDGAPFAAVSRWNDSDMSIWLWNGTWQQEAQLSLEPNRPPPGTLSTDETWITIVDATNDGVDDVVVWFWGPRRPTGVIISSANGAWENLGGGQQLQVAGPGLVSTVSNDCDPSCAEGTDLIYYYAWIGDRFTSCRELPYEEYSQRCALTPG